MSSEAAVLESIVRLREIDQLTKYLDYCAENRLFSCENNDTVEAIATTNRLLNESSTRRDGLLVLKCLLKQLPLKLLQTHIFSWVQQAVKGLSQKDSSSTILVALDLSGKLLSLSPNFPECRKQIAINFISKILEVLYDLKDSPGFLIPVLSTLGIVLEYYHKSLHSWKDKFEKFLISLIEKDDETVFLAARCFLAFGASGLPGADNVNYRENWVTLFKSLSSSLHSILDRLFENVNEIEQFSRGHDRIKPNFVIPTVNSAIPFVKMTRLAAQFSGLSRFLEVILLGKYPVCKKVTPELVLSVACRGLAISSQTLQSHVTSDTASLMTQLPQIHLSCLTILNALMKSCRKNLLSYGPVICKLLSQVLKATEIRKAVHGQNKPFRSVRQLTYKCLATWLTISNCSCRAEKFPELVDFLIADIQYKKPVVTLNMSTKVLKGKLGKKQRQALVNQTVENREEYVIDREANKDVCAAALEVVPILLQSASTLLPPLAQKALGEAVCSELITTQLNSIENAPLPYSDEQCRLGLYKCFVALCQDYHPEYPPPLSYAAQVLSVGLQDTCSEVARFCATASSAVDKMLRPIGPTLGLPMELPELLAPPKTAPTFVQIPCDQERRSPVMDTEDRKVNGVEANDSANVAELEVSPLLVDPEMSDFDYSNSAKEEPRSRGEPSQKLVDDHSPTLAKKEGYDASASVIPESNLSIEVSEPIPVVNGASVKRKSVINEEESHATKKSKSKESSVAPIPIHLSESPEAVSIEVCDSLPPMTNPVENIEDEIPVRKSSPPRNNLEEEMLSSFVDEVF